MSLSVLWIWMASAPAAAACPDLPSQLEQASTDFDEAEVESAKAAINAAYESLKCQEVVVSNEELLALYRLDGLVSLALQDEKGAVYATIRAVSANAEQEPPAELGPELKELYVTWKGRLSRVDVAVTVLDGGEAWVDGIPVRRDAPRRVVEGDHLIQVQTPEGIRSQVLELSKDHEITTGVALGGTAPVPAPVRPVPAPLPAPDPVTVAPTPLPAPLPKPVAVGRRHPAWLWGTGIATGLVGGGAIAYGYWTETRFKAHAFHADEYKGCQRGGSCYDEAREEVIRSAATSIRVFYGVGYGLTGVGAGMTLAGTIGLPKRVEATASRVEERTRSGP